MSQKKRQRPRAPEKPSVERAEKALEKAEVEDPLAALDVCYQCGECTGGCPVARIVPEYNVRKIIKAAREGKLQPDNNAIWLCSTCYTCHERCPQNVKPVTILHQMTNLASKKGCLPLPVKEGNRNILALGRILEVTRGTQQKRRMLGLPELKPNVSEDFRKIAEMTGMEKMLK